LIYLDTNVLVAYVNPKDGLHDRATSLVSRYSGKKMFVSQLVVLELYSVFSRVMAVGDVELEALVSYVMDRCGVELVDVEWSELYARSLSYANKLKLKTLDLLHVVAAYLLGTGTLISFDRDLNDRRGLIKSVLGIEVVGFQL